MRRRVSVGTSPAFTLIELLVVVAIIAVLVSILLPSLRHARWASYRVTCLANLSHLAQGWHYYCDENDDAFYRVPRGQYTYGGQQGSGSKWFGAYSSKPFPRPLNPYVGVPLITGRFLPGPGRNREVTGEARIFECPADNGSPSSQPSFYEWTGRSYHPNELLLGPDKMQWGADDPCAEVFAEMQSRFPRVRAASIDDPSRVVLLGDGGWFFWWAPDYTEVLDWHHTPSRYSLVFMDGHAELTKVHRGVHVTTDYIIFPYSDLSRKAGTFQIEVDK